MSVAPSAHDVIVVGGGVTGAGVARDLALRGVSVLLLEKGDWGGGTSGGSSWMIHGGPRYLEFDWETTRLSAQDAGHIVRIARHLVHRIAFLIPVLPGDRNNLERMETAMEVYDRFQPLKLSNTHVRLTREEALAIEPGLTPNLVGAVTMEEWGVDPHRLAWANVLDAVEHGARALNHARVSSLLRDQRSVIGVRYVRDGAEVEARARVVVNAAGPWVPELAAMAGQEVRLRPAKGIHIVFDRRISNFALSGEAIDGRDLLVVPHGPITVVGTTDDDFYGDLDSVDVLPDEVDYLLQGVERIFPAIREYRAVRATTGVRPTLHRWRLYEDDLSRRYEVIEHPAAPGLVSIAGGKLSMYRLMAEETADAVCRHLGLGSQNECSTWNIPLPGAEAERPSAAELAAEFGTTELAAARLLKRHGSRASAVLKEDTRHGRITCRCDPLLEAELVYAVRHEQVSGLADAFRRVSLAAGPCAGTACVQRAAEVVGRELGWSPAQRLEAAEDYWRGSWLGRAAVIDSRGWAQEELRRAAAPRVGAR
ncbi:MAG TPA: glycerol-3-phosphate dehydrogenase/oxidase [Candidatus Dormibacteraeota bacterium]